MLFSNGFPLLRNRAKEPECYFFNSQEEKQVREGRKEVMWRTCTTSYIYHIGQGKRYQAYGQYTASKVLQETLCLYSYTLLRCSSKCRLWVTRMGLQRVVSTTSKLTLGLTLSNRAWIQSNKGTEISKLRFWYNLSQLLLAVLPCPALQKRKHIRHLGQFGWEKKNWLSNICL